MDENVDAALCAGALQLSLVTAGSEGDAADAEAIA